MSDSEPAGSATPVPVEDQAREYLAAGHETDRTTAPGVVAATFESDRPARQPGATIAGYVLEKLIARGGMGEVYRAKRLADGTTVALKLMSGIIAHNASLKARFLREAKAIAKIEHRNAVRFIEAGLVEGGDPFLAMELVEGRTLEEILQGTAGEPFPLERALDLFTQICAGVAAAHAAGIIHRDVKPSNVLVDDHGTAKVIDFGISRREHESILLTNVGQVMGSPDFMSPEQAKGLPVDARTDVYALGALFYWLFIGRPPFVRDSTVETLQAHVSAPRPDIRLVRPEIPKAIARLGVTLLAREPQDRPRDAAEILRLLEPARRASDDEYDEPAEGGAELGPGTKIGPYSVVGLLGTGGMGAVYAVRDEKGCVTALKLLPTGDEKDEKRLRRFEAEGVLGATVQHANVVKTLSHGRLEGSKRPYIQLELIEGTALEAMVAAAGPLAPKLLLAVGRGLGKALRAVHAAGLVHRDVKPSNVLLSGDFLNADDAGVKLIDFGLVVKQGAVSALDQGLGGTPPFMSPEQLASDEKIDHAADLYSLGATLYYAATGHPPYEGPTLNAVVYQQRAGFPPPVKQINPKVSHGLDALIDALLEPNRAERIGSAGEFLGELGNVFGGALPEKRGHRLKAKQRAEAEAAAQPAPPGRDTGKLLRPAGGDTGRVSRPQAAAAPAAGRDTKSLQRPPSASAPAQSPRRASDRLAPAGVGGLPLGLQILIGIGLLIIGFVLGRL